MFTKILIANRGEIACRVIRTARQMGIATVAVYSDSDTNALHVTMADEAVHIGGSPASESYLLGDRIIEAAKKTGAQAIHPGYGFLSENAVFSRQCAENTLVFIGPPASAIEAMGSKSAAKAIMEKAGVPLVPGYHGDDQDPALLKKHADDMGYPVLLKAVAGGGGKGMRQVWKEREFNDALCAAKREAKASFGNDAMLVEKYLTQPRHVEVQVFCDQQDNGVYLFERDCSVQRRHQKVIEEAPAPGVSEELRKRMGETAVLAAKSIDYVGAGTVEFLLDVDGSYFFMEMNTRLQVEHPVTEMITGLDLVEWQLRIAAGEQLPAGQEDLQINGHAFEARIYAEDPNNDFLPVTGTLNYLQPPGEDGHVRVDTGVVRGDHVSVYYDPMIAKLIVWDESRDRALARLAKALLEYRITGVTTNIRFLYNLATSKAFRDAQLDTGFIDKHRDQVFHDTQMDIAEHLPLASLYLLLAREQNRQRQQNQNDATSPWNSATGWRLNAPKIHTGKITVNGESYSVPVEELGAGNHRRFRVFCGDRSVLANGELLGNELYADIDGHRQTVVVVPTDGRYVMFSRFGAVEFALDTPDYGAEDADPHGGFSAPMNGTIVSVLVAPGQQVSEGEGLIIMEAMKMEHTIKAPTDGTVNEIYFGEGELVSGGADLLAFTTAGEI